MGHARTSTSSKASRCSRWPRAISIWASSQDESEKKEQEKEAGEFKELTDKIGKTLGEKVKEVRVTHRLTELARLPGVATQYGMSMNLERLLKAAGQKVPDVKPILEINPHHPIVQGLKYEADETRFARLEPHPVRPGAARRRRPARRSRRAS